MAPRRHLLAQPLRDRVDLLHGRAPALGLPLTGRIALHQPGPLGALRRMAAHHARQVCRQRAQGDAAAHAQHAIGLRIQLDVARQKGQRQKLGKGLGHGQNGAGHQ